MSDYTTKRCTKCNIEYPATLEYFYTNRGRLGTKCKHCFSEYAKKYNSITAADRQEYKRKYRQTDKSKISYRNSYLKRTFGITLDEYNVLFYQQNGKCAICKNESKRTLCVDHNHETGEIRGLLCEGCNRGIGFLKESTEILQNAIKYLNENAA